MTARSRARGLGGVAILVISLAAPVASARSKKKASAPPPTTESQGPVPVGPTPFSCPAQQRVKVNLEQWLGWLKAATSWEEHNRLLARVRMKPVWIDRPTNSPPTCNEIVQLQSVERIDEDLSHARSPDAVIVARYNVCTQDARFAVRVQVLRPLGDDEWCALGDDLSLDRTVDKLGCDPEAQEKPRELSFESYTHAAQKTIAVRDRTGNCDPPHHDRHIDLSLWDVDGPALRSILTIPVLDAKPADPTKNEDGEEQPGEGEKVMVRTVKPTGSGFPRQLTVDERFQASDTSKPVTKKKVFTFRSGRYVED